MKKARKKRKIWSSSWKSSKKPKKQRKYRYNSPLHVKQKLIGCHLSKDLRRKHGTRAVQLRKGDKVKVMRGDFKKKTGKVEEIDLKNLSVSVGGIEINKKDGSKVKPYFQPSNLMVIELDLGDKRREEKLKKKSKAKEK